MKRLPWKERELREPLVDWEGKKLNWWREFLAFPLAALLVIVFIALEFCGRKPGQR